MPEIVFETLAVIACFAFSIRSLIAFYRNDKNAHWQSKRSTGIGKKLFKENHAPAVNGFYGAISFLGAIAILLDLLSKVINLH